MLPTSKNEQPWTGALQQSLQLVRKEKFGRKSRRKILFSQPARIKKCYLLYVSELFLASSALHILGAGVFWWQERGKCVFPYSIFFLMSLAGKGGKINNNLTACISFIHPILRPFLNSNIIGPGVEWKFIIHKFAGKQCHGSVWFGALLSLCS